MIYLMDSGTYAKRLRNPDLHINELCRRKGFSGRVIVDFSSVDQQW